MKKFNFALISQINVCMKQYGSAEDTKIFRLCTKLRKTYIKVEILTEILGKHCLVHT